MSNKNQVTVGFKVPPERKKEIEDTAKALKMDTSTYLRESIKGVHPKLQRLCHLPDELVISEEYIPEVEDLLYELKKKYKKNSTSEIIKATLELALENENRWASNKLKNYIK